MATTPLRFWVVESDLFADRGLAGFDTKAEAQDHRAALKQEHPMRKYNIERLRA